MINKGLRIYNNIERLAYAQGMTVGELCKKVKVSRGMIGDLKTGRRDSIGQITCEKLARGLGCEPDEIIPKGSEPIEVGEKPAVNKTAHFIEKATKALEDDVELRRLMRAAMKATRKQVRSTAALLETIVDMNMTDGDEGGVNGE